MSLNSGPINSKAINGTAAAFTPVTGGGVVVSIHQQVITPITGGGVVITIAQTVNALSTAGVVVDVRQRVGRLTPAAVAITIAQEVELRSTSTPGPVITIAQQVKSTGSKIIDIEQSVVVLSDPTSFYGRNGYEPMLYIGGERVPEGDVHGMIDCVYTENDAPQLSFTLIPDTGVQDIRSYRGKTVTYKIREATGITTMFVGKINTPDVQILDQKIKFNCSLDIEQMVETTMTRSDLDKIGYYNNGVFPTPENKLQELKDRVSTVPSVINFRKTGVPAVDLIASKASPDYTLTNGDVYRRDLKVKLGSGQRYINKVNLKVQYSYQRLHHHERSFSAGVGHTSVCEMLSDNYDILVRSLVASAVGGSGWPLKGSINYEGIYPSGWYSCGIGPGSTIGWSTVTETGSVQATVDVFGNAVTHNGEAVQEFTGRKIQDNTLALCNGASWTASTRFSQNVKTDYTISINAPQSQAQNGVKERDLNFSLASSFDSGSWENYNSHSSNVPQAASGTSGNNYWINADTNKSVFDQSVTIMLNKAKSDILKSHREDRVMFKRSLWTAIDLWQTIKLNCTKITATGRVFTFTHSIDIDSGEAYTSAELSMSQSTGSATDSALIIPATVTNTPVYPTQTVRFGNGHYGKAPGSPGSQYWSGHIANKRIPGSLFKTTYPESFVVNTPDIEPALRNQLTLTSSPSYNVEIPNDALSINFDQWED